MGRDDALTADVSKTAAEILQARAAVTRDRAENRALRAAQCDNCEPFRWPNAQTSRSVGRAGY